jgi:hypothetical protein
MSSSRKEGGAEREAGPERTSALSRAKYTNIPAKFKSHRIVFFAIFERFAG